MTTVLIAGGAGYVGSTLTQLLLEAGYRVRVFDRLDHGGRSLLGAWSHPNFELLRGDVRNQADVDRACEDEVNYVVNLAALVGDPACAANPDEARAVNLDGALRLYETAKQAGAERFVFASTCSNYGKMKDSNGYVDEESELAPVSLYAETKVGVERALLSDQQLGPMSPVLLRFATVYGVSPRMRFDLTVNEFTRDMVHKQHLIVFGEQFWRPYIHVRDVARAVVRVLELPSEKVHRSVFNVGSTQQNYQKKTLVELIAKHAPEAKIEYVKKEEDPRDYRVCFDKIEKQLGFRCQYTVEDGIASVAQLVRSGAISDLDSPEFRNIA